MRTIGKKEDHAVKAKKNARNFTIFLLGMLVLSSIGYAFLSNPNVGTKQTTNTNSGVSLVGDRWVFGNTGSEISLAYSPEEVENVSVSFFGTLNDYVQEPLFLDIENPGILTEIASPLQQYASRVQEACYGNCTRDLPEKDCSANIIVFRESDMQSVRQEQRCVFIEGDMKAADAFVYELFGITNS
ncbi:MAG TPA: hypothetical protein VHA12_04230 [Candidatus Nanoarchaeia archaeon]|nr:hypothetical protein [Candidatus Nanoarchaeia archaeon]